MCVRSCSSAISEYVNIWLNTIHTTYIQQYTYIHTYVRTFIIRTQLSKEAGYMVTSCVKLQGIMQKYTRFAASAVAVKIKIGS